MKTSDYFSNPVWITLFNPISCKYYFEKNVSNSRLTCEQIAVIARVQLELRWNIYCDFMLFLKHLGQTWLLGKLQWDATYTITASKPKICFTGDASSGLTAFEWGWTLVCDLTRSSVGSCPDVKNVSLRMCFFNKSRVDTSTRQPRGDAYGCHIATTYKTICRF